MVREDILNFLKSHKKEFEQNFGVTKIGLFGSYTKDKAKEVSDIDLVVEVKEPKMFKLIGLKQEIEEKLNKKVDIIRYRDRMNEFLKRRIEKEAVYV